MPNCLKRDLQGDPQEGQLLTVAEIQEKTHRYRDYMLTRTPPEEKVYLSNVFEKADLEKVLSDGCDGIRVMLVKEDDLGELNGQARVGLIVVPVKKIAVSGDLGKDESTTFKFENLLTDANHVIYVECPSKYCDSSTHTPILP